MSSQWSSGGAGSGGTGGGHTHIDEFIFNCCVSSMIAADEVSADEWSSAAMNVFSIDENKIRDANGIIFAEAITCYKCTFCGKMFAAMEVVLTHYQSNHRCSVIPLLKGIEKSRQSAPKLKTWKRNSPVIKKFQTNGTNGLKVGNKNKNLSDPKTPVTIQPKLDPKSGSENMKSNTNLRNATKSANQTTDKLSNNKVIKSTKRQFKCYFRGCEMRFNNKKDSIVHQKFHRKRLKSYKCSRSDCQFKCSDLAGLEFHKQSHLGDNPFRCSWPGCEQSFTDSTARDQHMQSEHIGDRILECDYPGCFAKFKQSSDRDRHRLIHTGKPKKLSVAPPKLVSTPVSGRRGRPPAKRKSYIEMSSSSESSEDNDESEEEDDDEESVADTNEPNQTNGDQLDGKEVDGDQPLDLSKSATNSKKESIKAMDTKKTTKNKKIKIEKSLKKSRKSNVKSTKLISESEKPIEKAIKTVTKFRCDYPGCRKTFADSDSLKSHEKDAHNTPSVTDNRSRYGRRCKGNLYYKV